MLIQLHRGKKAQSLVIVALSATALFGIIALGLDAGLLYFQRRDVQNGADAGPLAGSAVVADAYAHGGFVNKTYTIFGFDAGGNGNSVNFDQNGNVQIDDGLNGTDICNPSPTQGRLVSNAKWHAPNPGGGWNNLNGQFFYSQAADTHALVTYWYNNVATSQPVEQTPNYEPPLKPADALPPSGINPVVYHPGTYHSNINLTNNNGRYAIENGI